MHPPLSERLKAWSERQRNSRHGALPNLGFGGSLVAIFVSSFFAALVADALIVIVAFGWHAFFVDGLRVADWKRGILSNGAELNPALDVARMLLTVVLWAALVFLAESCIGLLTGALAHRPRWKSAARFLGGTLLLAFVAWLWLPGPLFHPIPIAAAIGGAALIWKGAAALLAR